MPSSDTVSFDTFLHDYGVLIKCLITNYPSGDFTYFLFVVKGQLVESPNWTKLTGVLCFVTLPLNLAFINDFCPALYMNM